MSCDHGTLIVDGCRRLAEMWRMATLRVAVPPALVVRLHEMTSRQRGPTKSFGPSYLGDQKRTQPGRNASKRRPEKKMAVQKDSHKFLLPLPACGRCRRPFWRAASAAVEKKPHPQERKKEEKEKRDWPFPALLWYSFCLFLFCFLSSENGQTARVRKQMRAVFLQRGDYKRQPARRPARYRA